MEADGATRHGLVLLAAEISPGLIDSDFFLKRDTGDFGGDFADAICRDTDAVSHSIGGVLRVEVAFGHHLEDRHMGDACMAVAAREVRLDAFGVDGGAPGAVGVNWVEMPDGTRIDLKGNDEIDLPAGALFGMMTPGGGGWGSA